MQVGPVDFNSLCLPTVKPLKRFVFFSFRVILSPPEMFESSCTGSLSPAVTYYKLSPERAKMS